MQTLTINNRGFLFVEVPEDAKNFRLIMRGELAYDTPWSKYHNVVDGTSLPKHDYTIIGLASNLSEEQCIPLVEGDKFGECIHEENSHVFNMYYRDYSATHKSYPFTTAKESLYSLIRSKGREPETTVIISKK